MIAVCWYNYRYLSLRAEHSMLISVHDWIGGWGLLTVGLSNYECLLFLLEYRLTM